MPMSDDTRHADAGRPTYSADRVRQGDIVLRTRTRRLIFIAGLAGLVVLALVVRFLLAV